MDSKGRLGRQERKDVKEEQDRLETQHEFRKIASNSQQILITADSVFPFDFIPDTITVDRVKVTIIRRTFIMVSEVISTQIEDILNVECDTGPFFGSINLYTRFFEHTPLRINFLTRRKAVDIKNILQGFIIARHQGLDSSKLKLEELRILLLRLGSENT